MWKRNTNGGLLSVGPTGPTWWTGITEEIRSDHILPTSCDTMKLTLNFLITIVTMVGMAGNAMVLWLLGFHMHKNTFSVYLLNLAGADFLFLCFQNVYSLQVIINMFHSIFIPSLFTVLFDFSYLAGLSMLSAISTERCLSALWPIWYHCQRPRNTSAIMCVLLWALSLVLSTLQGEACMAAFNGFGHGWCKSIDLIIFAWLAVLFVVLSGSSLTLLLRVICGSHRIPVTRLYVTIALTVLVFLFFGLSYGMNWFLFYWVDIYSISPCNVYEITVLLSCVNCCANPIIYFFVGSFRHYKVQKQTLKLILQRAMQDTPDEGQGGEGAPSGNPGEMEIV